MLGPLTEPERPNDVRDACRVGMTNFGGGCGVNCGGVELAEACRVSVGRVSDGELVTWTEVARVGAAAAFRGGIAGGGPRPAVEPCDWTRGGTWGNLELGAATLGAFCGGAFTDVIDDRGDVVLGGDDGVGFVCG